MNLYLLTRTDITDYDEYDSTVVAAETEAEAKNIHPSDYVLGMWIDWDDAKHDAGSWVSSIDKLSVKFLGVATEGIKKGPILSSFNAG